MTFLQLVVDRDSPGASRFPKDGIVTFFCHPWGDPSSDAVPPDQIKSFCRVVPTSFSPSSVSEGGVITTLVSRILCNSSAAKDVENLPFSTIQKIELDF